MAKKVVVKIIEIFKPQDTFDFDFSSVTRLLINTYSTQIPCIIKHTYFRFAAHQIEIYIS